MNYLDSSYLTKVITASAVTRPNAANMNSVVVSLGRFGEKCGMDRPHRLAQYIPQLGHESLDFRYDREIWDGKGAQARYDTRTDLGNTPERDGDGYTFRGRTGIQLTGKSNYGLFTVWSHNLDQNAPNFVKNPDLVNTDPWEGLVPLWYWQMRSINRHADTGNSEMVTRSINGGLNGYADRLNRLTRTSLVLLGFGPTDVIDFQRSRRLTADGIVGALTRASMHNALLSCPT